VSVWRLIDDQGPHLSVATAGSDRACCSNQDKTRRHRPSNERDTRSSSKGMRSCIFSRVLTARVPCGIDPVLGWRDVVACMWFGPLRRPQHAFH
jgi:hypothetical protein